MPQIKPDEMIPGMGSMLARKPIIRADYTLGGQSVDTTAAVELATTGEVHLPRPGLVQMRFHSTLYQEDLLDYLMYTGFYEDGVGLPMYCVAKFVSTIRQQWPIAMEWIVPKPPGNYTWSVKAASGTAGRGGNFTLSFFIVEVLM